MKELRGLICGALAMLLITAGGAWTQQRTVVTTDQVQTLTNKTIDGATTTYSGTHTIPTVVSDTLRVKVAPWVDVKAHGAKGDGVTDDTAAIQAAIAACPSGGCRVMAPAGQTFKTTQKIVISKSNMIVDFNGSEILFQPTDPVTHDRAVLVHAGDGSDLSAARPITGAIALNATTFTATNAANVNDLIAGGWLFIEERDIGHGGEIIFADWVQVASVTSPVVTIRGAFRTAFPATHGTVNFYRVLNLVENVTVQNTRVRTTLTSPNLLAFAVGVARNVTFDNVRGEVVNGSPFFTYRSANVRVTNSHGLVTSQGHSEFAATAGLDISGTIFEARGTANALTLDFGTSFCTVAGNHVPTSFNIGMQLLDIHNCAVVGNTVSSVTGIGSGITMSGSRDVSITANTLHGTGLGISVTNDGTASPTIVSEKNVISGNILSGFTNAYQSVLGATDSWYLPNYNGVFGAPTAGVSIMTGPMTLRPVDGINLEVLDAAGLQLRSLNNARSAFQTLRIDGNDLLLNTFSGGKVGIRNASPASLLSIGAAGTTLGTMDLQGSTSGIITIQPQAAAGTYTFNLPTTAGTSGQPLLSGGGAGAAQTYGILSSAAGGTGANLSAATSGTYPKANGAGVYAASTLAASGVGVCSASTVVTGLGADAAPTCTTVDDARVSNDLTIIHTVPAAQTIAAGNTVTADACGTIKQVTSAEAVTTSTTDTFTTPAAANNGCLMDVCNTGMNTITLDANANFVSAGAADVALTGADCVRVGSNGTVWRQLGPMVAN